MLEGLQISFPVKAESQSRSLLLQVRTLSSQVRLDARTKLLNPKWYEGMMSSGYEGVREIQKRLTNTMGWSATSGQVRLLPAAIQHLSVLGIVIALVVKMITALPPIRLWVNAARIQAVKHSPRHAAGLKKS